MSKLYIKEDSITNLDTSNIIKISQMLSGCSNLKSIINFDTSKINLTQRIDRMNIRQKEFCIENNFHIWHEIDQNGDYVELVSIPGKYSIEYNSLS